MKTWGDGDTVIWIYSLIELARDKSRPYLSFEHTSTNFQGLQGYECGRPSHKKKSKRHESHNGDIHLHLNLEPWLRQERDDHNATTCNHTILHTTPGTNSASQLGKKIRSAPYQAWKISCIIF